MSIMTMHSVSTHAPPVITRIYRKYCIGKFCILEYYLNLISLKLLISSKNDNVK